MSDLMSHNVDNILNPNYDDSKTTLSTFKIVDRPYRGYYDLYVKFFGDNFVTNAKYEFEPIQINNLFIQQNFNKKYTDEISLNVSLTPEQFLTMFDNSRELKCTIEFRLRSKDYDYIENEPLITKTYRAIFKEKTDIRKRIPKDVLIPKDTIEQSTVQTDQLFSSVEFQLMEELPYNLRKVKMNMQARGVTVKDMILLVCKVCEIKTICLTEPDNDTVYDNFIIPPTMTFDEVMNYFQDYYGVYDKGFQYYFTDDILYIFPPYETEPESPETSHMYYAGANDHGVEVFHAYDDAGFAHIVINNAVNSNDLADQAVENIGTGVIFQDATRVIDLASTIGEAEDQFRAFLGLGALDVKDANTGMHMCNDDDVGASYNVYNPMFQFDYGNRYKYRSIINSYRRNIISSNWNSAVPFTFKPGYKVYYHFDSEDPARREQGNVVGDSFLYNTKSGVCEGIMYKFEPVSKKGEDWIYNCIGTFNLSCEFDKAKQEPKGGNVSSIPSAKATKELTGGNTGALSQNNIPVDIPIEAATSFFA